MDQKPFSIRVTQSCRKGSVSQKRPRTDIAVLGPPSAVEARPAAQPIARTRMPVKEAKLSFKAE